LMKKKLGLAIAVMMILASATVLFSAGTVEAHAPSDVTIDYDIEEEELTVDITHSVGDPQTHYIENVVVEVDGTEEIDEEYEEQPDDTSFQYTYDLVVEPGSTIEVTAYCNQGGSGSDTYEVEEDDDDEPYVVEFWVNEEDEDVVIPYDEEVHVYAEVNNPLGEEVVMVVTVYEDDGDQRHQWEETIEAEGTGVIDNSRDDHVDNWEPGDYEVELVVNDYIDESIDITVEEDDDDEPYVVEFWVNEEDEDVVIPYDEEVHVYAVMVVTVYEDDGDQRHQWEETIEAEGTGVIDNSRDDHVDNWEPGDYEVELVVNDYIDESIDVTVEEDDDDTPGFTTILLVLAVVVAVIVYRKKRF